METAVDNLSLHIPLIDLRQFVHATDETTKISVATAVAEGFQTAGFIYLKNHGIAQNDIDQLFSESAKFFNRPQKQKDLLSWGLTDKSSSPGYTAYGGEKLSQSLDQSEIDELRATNPDMKEAFDVGAERVCGGEENIWQGENDSKLTQMKLVIQDFHQKCRRVQVQIMHAIALGMGLEERYFDQYICDADNTLRCLHYPPVKAEVFERKGAVRAGAHSDYGSITLLFQDSRGGLQVSSPDGTFVDVTPIPGTIVVNAGDMLSRWANDKIKSTVHRVVQPSLSAVKKETVSEYPARYSVAYFCNPNMDAVIDALPGTWEEAGKRYEAVTAKQWLMKRLQLGHTAETKL